MNARRIGGLAVTGLLALFVVSMAAGVLLGQPVLLGYVETGSMVPTLEPGDGFVAVPSVLVGPVEPGDVVVYEATVIDGGGLVTHRVVGETGDGFVTRGDANVVTDQDSGEPPVRREQIAAEAFQVGDRLVVVPKIGLFISPVQGFVGSMGSALGGGSQSLAYLIFAIGVGAYVASEVAERRDDDRHVRGAPSRDDGAVEARYVVLVGTVAVLALVTGAMLATGNAHEFGMVSAETDSARQYVVQHGTTENVTYGVPSYGVVPATVVLETRTDDVSVEPGATYVPAGGTVNATVTLSAPPETGYYPQLLVEHRYIGILPVGVVTALYSVHPWLPVLVIDLLVGVGLGGLGFALVGDRRIRLDSRSRNPPISQRLRRWLR